MNPAVLYTIGINQPQRHLLDVQMVINDVTTPTVQVQMATWTPGSYLLREYARNVRSVRATSDDGPLPIRKIDKATWEIETGGATCVSVSYEVYGYELTVRTNHIERTHAHIVPAATLMYVPDRSDAEFHVQIIAPENWQIATGLDPLPDAEAPTYIAHGLDHLLDSPFEVGLHRRFEFTVDAVPHALVIWGSGNEDSARLVADTTRIVETERDFWGDLPYDHYTFFLLLGGPNVGGGLEHRNSTSLLVPRHIFKPRRNYERFLTVTAHEFFHVWNVKRLRSEVLGPFDYHRENYTRLLWLMEGVTEYYTDLLLTRAGLFTPERYLERLAEDIVTLQTTPGRQMSSLSDASFDAWIKFYRPDETTPNTTISYYLKGALAALVLDMTIRERTSNQRSLDDLMRYLYTTYPFDGPGISEVDGIEQALQAVAPGDWDWHEWTKHFIHGTEELPFEQALHTVGVEMQWGYQNTVADSDDPQPKLGVKVKPHQGRLQITHVIDGGAADVSGLAPGDEIIALDSWRVDADLLATRLADYAIGDTVQVTLFRNDVLTTVALTLNTPTRDKLTLSLVDAPTDQQRTTYRTWLGQALDTDQSADSARLSGSSVGTEEVNRAADRQPT